MPAPPDSAPPPEPQFKLSRETRITIDREGRFFNEGDPITHPTLVRALASWVDIDEESGRYILRNSVNWAFVTVEDAPLVVRALHVTPGPAFTITTSDGATEPLDLASLRLDAEEVPYCDVRGGKLPARFGRAAAYTLLSHVRVGEDGAVKLGEREIPRVAKGAAR